MALQADEDVVVPIKEKHPVATSGLILTVLLIVSLALVIVSAVLFQAPELLGRDKVLTDFDAFYVAGSLADAGKAADAYHIDTMLDAQREFSGTNSFMPWTYPPPYTLAVVLLAQLPIGVAYFLFATLTFLFYLLVLRRIAGVYLPGVLIALIPTIMLTLRSGQNGFLSAGLIGCFLLAIPAGRAIAGIPLGLMIIKPHLAAGIALLALFERRWSAIVSAAAIVIASIALSTMAFGPAIWREFVEALRESSYFLAEGFYPLYRMSSLYAFLRSLGLAADWSLTAHGLFSVVAVGVVVQLWRRGVSPRLLAGTTCVVSLFVSPYSYDYDLAILGVGIAFLLPDLLRVATRSQMIVLLGACWFATGYGLALQTWLEAGDTSVIFLGDEPSVGAFIFPALLSLIVAGLALLFRGGYHFEKEEQHYSD